MQYLKDEVRDDILNAALEEFYLKGYKSSSMRNIAQNAGMTVGNLYRYFKNKDALFNELIEPVAQAIIALIDSHEKHELFENGNLEALNSFLAKSLMHIHDNYPKELSVLLHGCQESSYATFKDNLIDSLAAHIQDHCYLIGGCQGTIQVEPIIYRILAKNNVEGFIMILESDLDKASKEKAVFQYSELLTRLNFCHHTD